MRFLRSGFVYSDDESDHCSIGHLRDTLTCMKRLFFFLVLLLVILGAGCTKGDEELFVGVGDIDTPHQSNSGIQLETTTNPDAQIQSPR